MKKLILSIFVFFTVFMGSANASIFGGSDSKIPYCDGDDCGLEQGVNQIQESGIDGVVTEGRASEYIQAIIAYVLGFLSLIAVILIIYAGFNLLTSAGDEEKAKKSKTIIIFSIIGLVIIYLAGPITNFVIDVLTQNS